MVPFQGDFHLRLVKDLIWLKKCDLQHLFPKTFCGCQTQPRWTWKIDSVYWPLDNSNSCECYWSYVVLTTHSLLCYLAVKKVSCEAILLCSGATRWTETANYHLPQKRVNFRPNVSRPASCKPLDSDKLLYFELLLDRPSLPLPSAPWVHSSLQQGGICTYVMGSKEVREREETDS